ncbi:MAG: hypothetical protein M0Z59_09780 [Nitrospiraceae bacterium]|nr:hypothetical protein [Nitrospiraceae bacterium]
METNRGAAEKEIPGWLCLREPGRGGGKNLSGKRPVLERTLKSVLSFFDDAVFNEEVSKKKNMFLQGTDPRVKMLIILALLAALSFVKNPAGMLPYAAFCVLAAALSGVPLAKYFKRLFPALLFTSVIALPAAFNLIVPGRPLLMVLKPGAAFAKTGIFITEQGFFSAVGLILRVLVSLMLIFLLTFTTRPVDFIKTAGSFAPGFLKTLMSVSYRYIYFLARRLEEFIFVQRARGLGRGGGRERAWAGARGAALLLLALELKDELKFAMEARGVSGHSIREHRQKKFHFGAREAALLLLALTAVLA